MENLKKVNINELNDEQLQNHVENILKLKDIEIVLYLMYIINNQNDIDGCIEIDKTKNKNILNKNLYKLFNHKDILKYLS